MSQPLWLMMGTAFRVEPPSIRCASGEETASTSAGLESRPLFLSAKHTFAPWDFTKNSGDLKIPEDYRKARYVVGKMYAYDTATGDAAAAQSEALSLISVHPTLDVALLSLRQWPPASPAADMFTNAPALSLLPAERVLKKDTTGVIEGFRGTGRLGELDTFDPSLLQKLPPADRDALIKELQNVEGRQTRAHTAVRVLDPLGVCRGTGTTHSVCYHGMSGGPLVVQTAGEKGVTTTPLCTGILYGKHPDHPQSIGYTPTDAFVAWFKEAAARFAKTRASGAES